MNYNLKDYFAYNTPFTAQELYDFYKESGEELNPNTFRWRIYNLKSKGIISSIKRGVYILEEKINFEYNITKDMKKIFNTVNKTLSYTDMCIWNTLWLHDFMNHQPFNSIIIFEVEKEVLNIAFQTLKEKFNNVYLNPNTNQITDYILDENAIIVRPIIKSAPLIKEEKILVPKIEKILVDLFFDNNLLLSYKGDEMINIFDNIYQKYSLNMTTLYNYSKKRGIYDKLKLFLLYETHIDKKYL